MNRTSRVLADRGERREIGARETPGIAPDALSPGVLDLLPRPPKRETSKAGHRALRARQAQGQLTRPQHTAEPRPERAAAKGPSPCGSCPRKGAPAPSDNQSRPRGCLRPSPALLTVSPRHSVLPALFLFILSKPTCSPLPPLPPCPRRQACDRDGPHASPISAQNLPSQRGPT